MRILSTRKILVSGLAALSLVLAGCLTDDDKDEETVVTPVAWTTDSTVTVGAQGHLTLGTAIDLDARNVLKDSLVKKDSSNSWANQRFVDVLFAFSGGSVKLMSAVAAKAAGDVPLALTYRDSLIFATKFVKVATKPANYTAGKAAYDSAATTAQISSSTVVTGDMFVVKTNLAEYVLVSVDTIIGGTANTASATLKLNLKGM